ncbi:unnamed protein product, partial [Owenia fusiformis]
VIMEENILIKKFATVSNEALNTKAQLENGDAGSIKDHTMRKCKACMDSDHGICTLEFKEQQSILFDFDGVQSLGLKPDESCFSIYLYDKDDESTQMKIKEKYPQHKFNFLAALTTKSFSLGHIGIEEKIGTPTMGTLGGHIRLNSDIYGLTCHHVVKDASHGQNVGVYKKEQAGLTWTPIGTLECSLAFDPHERQVETYDIALIKMTQSHNQQPDDCRSCEMATIDDLKHRRDEIQEIGDIKVQKKGSMTGETESIVAQLDFSGKITYKENGKDKCAVLLKAIQIKNDGQTPFAKQGDSGSIVYHRDESKKLVIGMFYALETTREGEKFAYAFPLQNAFEKLKGLYPDILGDATFGPNGNVKFTCHGEICQEAMTI